MTGKIPAYLQDVIHFPISENGYTYSLIMIGFAVTLLTCGFMADLIIKNTRLSKTTVRKIFQTISGAGMSLTLILIPIVGCNRLLNISLLTICMLSYGFTSGGDVPIVPDMTEEFSGTVFAIMNSMCSISGFVVPYFVGLIIDNNPNSMRLWSYTFYLSAIIDIFGTIIFVVYASAEPQNWEISSDESDQDFENEINLSKNINRDFKNKNIYNSF
jgi:ACS family sodium-dependent inorganic phosphate cotransporter